MAATQTATKRTPDTSALVRKVLGEDLQSKSDEKILEFQNWFNTRIVRLLNALTSPFTEPVEEFLSEIQRSVIASPHGLGSYIRNPAFYFGQLYTLAEIASTVRQMKVPASAAEIVLNRPVALSIARCVIEHDAISKSELAKQLAKAQSNLHPVLTEMEATGLIRRDEIGSSVVYSATPLTRTCIQWAEQNENASHSREYDAAG